MAENGAVLLSVQIQSYDPAIRGRNFERKKEAMDMQLSAFSGKRNGIAFS